MSEFLDTKLEYRKFIEGSSNPRAFSESGDVGGTIGSSQAISVSEGVFGQISSASDTDMYSVLVTDGDFYEVNLGPDLTKALSLGDTTLTLYDSAGTEIDFNDDYIGFESQIVFQATSNGPYYLQVDGFDTDTGYYKMTVDPIAPPPPSTLTDAIDWDYTAPTIINVHFGERFVAVVDALIDTGNFFISDGWTTAEKASAISAFDTISAVANVQFNYVDTLAEADFAMWATDDATSDYGYWDVGMGVNGPLETSQGTFELEGMGVFNIDEASWDFGGLSKGGFSYVTLIHEIGHGMGLAHPHDNGGGSDVLDGVSSPYGDYGDFDLNQGVYTTMSYNDSWLTGPHTFNVSTLGDYGYQASMMALDIAELQEKYGANTTTASGNDVYTLPTLNAPGTYYQAIWDTGGVDKIQVGFTNRDVTIDLRAATLDYSATGGGVVSFADNVHGGFTIANGVLIENASGSNGDDYLKGNDASNELRGGRGSDTLSGGDGNDKLIGGAGGDELVGGSGIDTASYDDTTTAVRAGLHNSGINSGDAAGDTYDGIENLFGSIKSDRLWGDAQDNVVNGQWGNDVLFGREGSDLLLGHKGNDQLYGNNGNDKLNGNDGNDVLRGGSGDDIMYGGRGFDVLYGQSGSDLLQGGGGRDNLYGGTGADKFQFNLTSDSQVGGRDNIMDFGAADTIDLGNIDADINTGGNQAFTFIGMSAFSGAAGELRYVTGANLGQGNTGAAVMADVDGDGAHDLVIGVVDEFTLTASDFIL